MLDPYTNKTYKDLQSLIGQKMMKEAVTSSSGGKLNPAELRAFVSKLGKSTPSSTTTPSSTPSSTTTPPPESKDASPIINPNPRPKPGEQKPLTPQEKEVAKKLLQKDPNYKPRTPPGYTPPLNSSVSSNIQKYS
jgi:hypothetical protein